MSPASWATVRVATLADVAEVARLAARGLGERLQGEPALSAPEIAVRLLEDLETGDQLYVGERQGRVVGFAQASELMVAEGGHVVDLLRIYVAPEHRRQGLGGALVRALLHSFRPPVRPVLRAWAPYNSPIERFFQATGARPLRQRWKVVGEVALRGMVYAWSRSEPARAGERLAR
ncbi:MAG TPA: GNAT family N-acetyltransferase [Candidatus Dormibacteraeota bacterium]|nr:GNAT family N-acetyltransferase [Candidatus Dormibacteraeota bacterium]